MLPLEVPMASHSKPDRESFCLDCHVSCLDYRTLAKHQTAPRQHPKPNEIMHLRRPDAVIPFYWISSLFSHCAFLLMFFRPFF